MSKSTLVWKGFNWIVCINYNPCLSEVRAETQTRNLKAETEAGTWENSSYWFVSHELLSFLFYASQKLLHISGKTHSELELASFVNQEIDPDRLAHRQV